MSADLTAARTNMVESQVRTQDVTEVTIHDAMRVVRREDLLPPAKAHAAYADTEVEYAPGRFLLRPRDVAKLLQELHPEPFEKALAIAAPYAAAVLEKMGLTVDRMDGDDLTAVGGRDYDIVICEGAVASTPAAWLDALGANGRLGIVERSGPAAKGVIYVRAGQGAGRREVFDASGHYLPGFEPERRFAF